MDNVRLFPKPVRPSNYEYLISVLGSARRNAELDNFVGATQALREVKNRCALRPDVRGRVANLITLAQNRDKAITRLLDSLIHDLQHVQKNGGHR